MLAGGVFDEDVPMDDGMILEGDEEEENSQIFNDAGDQEESDYE